MGAKAPRFEALDGTHAPKRRCALTLKFGKQGQNSHFLRRKRARNGTPRERKLWLCYRCATHSGAILKGARLGETGVVMANETTKQKDTMKMEKLSLLVLTLCIVVLVYVLVARPF